MNSKIFGILEYPQIQGRLENRATSQPGMAVCKNLMSETDILKPFSGYKTKDVILSRNDNSHAQSVVVVIPIFQLRQESI